VHLRLDGKSLNLVVHVVSFFSRADTRAQFDDREVVYSENGIRDDIGPAGPRTKKVYFPKFESGQEYEAGKLDKIRGASPAAIRVIDTHQPYAGGNGWALWDMNEMSNRDKHRLLIPVWGSLIGHSFSVSARIRHEDIFKEQFPSGIPRGILMTPAGRHYLKDGGKLLTIPIAEVDDHMDFRTNLAFGEPEQVRGKEVISTLMNMHHLVLKDHCGSQQKRTAVRSTMNSKDN
jgi:hypothetical protein